MFNGQIASILSNISALVAVVWRWCMDGATGIGPVLDFRKS